MELSLTSSTTSKPLEQPSEKQLKLAQLQKRIGTRVSELIKVLLENGFCETSDSGQPV